MRIWTEAAKAAQREAIKRWQPWAKSTGPRTAEGKGRSSSNARKHGHSSIKSLRTLSAALTAQGRCRRAFEAFNHWKYKENNENRTIMLVYLRSVYQAAERAFYKGMSDWCDREEAESAENPLLNDRSYVENLRMAA